MDYNMEMAGLINNQSNYDNLQFLKVTEDRIRIAFKYDNMNDMWIDFMKVGVNSLMGLSHFFLARNESSETSSDLDREAQLFFENCSDWIGPYIMKAAVGDGDRSGFTGGWHGTESDPDSGIPTARTLRYKVFADGEEVLSDKVIQCKTVKIVVENLIQGGNTMQSDGKGREILMELVEYEFIGSRNNVKVETQALEDISISRYYGLQTVNNPWFGTLTYQSTKNDKRYTVDTRIRSNSGAKIESPDIDVMTFIPDEGEYGMVVWLDRECGLGNMEWVADDKPCAFTEDYGKSYFNLINGKEKVLLKNEKMFWRGSYFFIGN